MKVGDKISFYTSCNADRKRHFGTVSNDKGLGLICIIDEQKYEVKKLIDVKILKATKNYVIESKGFKKGVLRSSNLKEYIKQGEMYQKLVDAMNTNPTKEIFLKLRKKLEFRELKNNNWQKVNIYSDNYKDFQYIVLYEKYTFRPYAIGRY